LRAVALGINKVSAPEPDLRQLAYLEALGVPVWVRREPGDVSAAIPPREVGRPPGAPEHGSAAALPPSDLEIRAPGEPTVESMDWDDLQRTVSSCTLCALHRARKRTVFGTGNREARWLFIGEAPGVDEDRQGEPFVGRAGQLLTNMIRALGYRREAVYIANILKCRPPGNRDPAPEESLRCRPYLRRQIALLSPGIIVTLGRVASQNLLQTDRPISRLRGRPHQYEATGIPVVVTYHPAYLLRSPTEKRKAWEDLRMARSLLAKV